MKRNLILITILINFVYSYSQSQCNSLRQKNENYATGDNAISWCDFSKPTPYTKCKCNEERSRKAETQNRIREGEQFISETTRLKNLENQAKNKGDYQTAINYLKSRINFVNNSIRYKNANAYYKDEMTKTLYAQLRYYEGKLKNAGSSNTKQTISKSPTLSSKTNLNQNTKLQKQQYQQGVTNAIANSFDNEGNINPAVFVQSLPSARTETEAYTNLALSGVAVLGKFLFNSDDKDYEAERLAKIKEEKRQRWEKLKNGIGNYDSNNQKTGKWAYFYEGSTAPKSSGTYVNGQKDGLWEYYEDQSYSKIMEKKYKEVIIYLNGLLKKTYKAKADERDRNYFLIDSNSNETRYGLWNQYNYNGVNVSSGYYNVKGNPTGLWTFGSTWIDNNYQRPYTKKYHIYSKVSYMDGKKTGVETIYHYNGNKKIELFYPRNEGEITKKKIYDTKGNFIKEEKVNFFETLLINHPINLEKLKTSFHNYTNTTGVIFGANIDSVPFKALQNLPKLEWIALHSLKLVENDLQEVSNFKNLKELQIYNRNRKVKDNFTYIPDALTSLTFIDTLLIRGTSLTRISANIANLNNLVKVRIFDNQVKYIDEGLCKLNKLEKLDLRYNEIEALPENIGDLSNLRELKLDGNNLTELPASIIKLKKLELLDLDRNPLKDLPDGFESLKSLKKVFLPKALKKQFKKKIKLLKKNNPSVHVGFL